MRKSIRRAARREARADVDVVVPVPDSGVPAALGYAQASGIPFRARHHPQPLRRPHLHPADPGDAQAGVKLKHNANRAVVAGKRIVLIDDSLVRGTTSMKIVRMMREAGAKEVHFRIASPPITHPDYYGIDTPERDNLLAANHSVEEMRQFIGADSSPSCRSTASTARWVRRRATRCGRSSPTTASPASTRPASPTRTPTRPSPRQLSLLAEAS